MWLQISNQPFTIGFFLYTFITDLPAGHLQFAMVNFGPLNQGLRALGFGPFMFSGPSLAIKEWSDKPFLRCFLKKNTKNTRTLKPSPQFLEEAGPNHLNQTMGDEIRSDPGLFAWAADLHHMHRGGKKTSQKLVESLSRGKIPTTDQLAVFL